MSEIIINVDPEDVPVVTVTVDENSAQSAADSAAAAELALEQINETDFGGKLDKDGYTGTAKDLNDSITALETPDIVLKEGVIAIDELTVTIEANDFQWRLNQVNHIVTPAYSQLLVAATEGFKRTDLLEGDATGNFFINQGTEGEFAAPAPSVTVGRIRLAAIPIFGSVVGTPDVGTPVESSPTDKPISVYGVFDKGISLYKDKISIWRYIGVISKYVNIYWSNINNIYDIQFPNKPAGTETFAMLSDLESKLDASDYNQHFKGVYLTETALNTAHPTASVGDYAQVNEVGATDVVNYNWDAEENIWVKNITEGGSSATNTDALPEGTANLYFTVTRFLANLTYANVISALGFTPSTAPNNAQKNSDITKAEIEAKLTGEITSHTHPNSGGGDMTTTTDQTVSGIKTFLAGKFGFRNVANTFTSFITNANTASRTYTLQNRDGILLDNTDLSTINTSIATKMANPTGGIVNYLPKFLTATTMGISRLFDDGTFFGLGTANAPTKDFTLGNQANRKIGVEASNSTTAGRDLDTEAGMTVNYALSSEFIATNIGVNGIRDMCVGMNNDVYLAYYGSVLKQTGGSGAFTTVYTGALQVHGIAVHKTTGTVLIAINGGGILKQTNGTGSFIDTGETVRNYRCIRIHQNGNIYATTDVGCFMQTSGTGAYSLVSSVTFLYGLAIDPISGDVYFNSGNSVSLYLQTAGSGTFNLVGNNLSDRQMCFDNLGNFYVFLNNYLYKRTAGSSVYNKITTITGALFAVGVLDNGNVYTADYYLNNIYIQNNVATGTPNLDGGTRRDKAGTGKGTGKSWYEIWTGQKTTSGTDMQVSTIRLRVDETGNIILFTDKIFANNADALAGGLPLKTIYWTTTGEMRIVV